MPEICWCGLDVKATKIASEIGINVCFLAAMSSRDFAKEIINKFVLEILILSNRTSKDKLKKGMKITYIIMLT